MAQQQYIQVTANTVLPFLVTGSSGVTSSGILTDAGVQITTDSGTPITTSS